MREHPHKPVRKTLRLKEYDYSLHGGYFATVCTQDNECILGSISSEKVNLSEAGEVARKWWLELPNKFKNISLDEYIIMPNHIHAIIIINDVGADLCVSPKESDFGINLTEGVGADLCVSPHECKKKDSVMEDIPHMIRWFKTMTTNDYSRGVKKGLFKEFNKRLWQRNYYEHVIRNEKDMLRIQQYIIDNPLRWEDDEENPRNMIKMGFS